MDFGRTQWWVCRYLRGEWKGIKLIRCPWSILTIQSIWHHLSDNSCAENHCHPPNRLKPENSFGCHTGTIICHHYSDNKCAHQQPGHMCSLSFHLVLITGNSYTSRVAFSQILEPSHNPVWRSPPFNYKRWVALPTGQAAQQASPTCVYDT